MRPGHQSQSIIQNLLNRSHPTKIFDRPYSQLRVRQYHNIPHQEPFTREPSSQHTAAQSTEGEETSIDFKNEDMKFLSRRYLSHIFYSCVLMKIIYI